MTSKHSALPTSKKWGKLSSITLSLLMAGLSSAAYANNSQELRICASNEAPFSQTDGQGFENRIAVAIAEAMERKPVFIYSERPGIYLVRDYLDQNLCDVVMGLDQGDPRVLTTNPYYRTSYVIVTRKDKNITLKDWNDDNLAKLTNIAVPLNSPPVEMLKAIGKYENNMNYMYSLIDFKQPRNQYVRVDPARMINDVVQNKADAALAFGSEVARYVKTSSVPLDMAILPPDTVPDHNNQTIGFVYSESMAVRKDDTALLEALNQALPKAQTKINEILQDEGIPLLELDS
ncbi:methanol oxidation system protein MoxJ [Paenalcaligenes niemegkensis]|uniref:methanol oxidation system protein MoxJ n=1 Tax=Paenalcaligenes niemegkensis TaxID=2895469 RepID=UPI001EE82204|nr:methanol oxidation system protein MoxJ [Paenalcaligenes niemegkensis]MCQ9615830.1 methanol oxidation system protein MoxJ [Paenalcaligenes niemegkensis]